MQQSPPRLHPPHLFLRHPPLPPALPHHRPCLLWLLAGSLTAATQTLCQGLEAMSLGLLRSQQASVHIAHIRKSLARPCLMYFSQLLVTLAMWHFSV
jgi:hypothetical protein